LDAGRDGLGFAVEDVSLEGLVGESDGDVAAIIEGLFESVAKFFFARAFEGLALKVFMLEARYYFEFFYVDGAQTSTSSRSEASCFTVNCTSPALAWTD